MLTKRQQQAMIKMRVNGTMWPSCLFVGLLGTTLNSYFAYMSAYAVMDAGLAAFDGRNIYLTPTGERLADILAELPAPLTQRQWQILLRFRDVGSGGDSFLRIAIWGPLTRAWCLPTRTMSEDATTNVRTMRILCDYGLIGFEYKHDEPYAHLTPLGEELVSLLP